MIKPSDCSYLELKGITKNFGGLTAVHHLSLTVQKGELVSVIGPNGAGKTTLLNLITKILPVTGGEIWFKGQRIDKFSPHHVCHLGIGRSFQNLQLFTNMSVIENVMIGCHRWMHATFPEVMFSFGRVRREHREAFDRAMEQLRLFGLEKRANEMPGSLALKDQKFLGIARALATEPELLLLDEPVGGLTVEEINEVSEKILTMQEKGLTILFIEHRMELVMGISERVMVIDFGQKIAEGTCEEIQKNERVITAYLGKMEK
jgi:ABC-type branched-subunit amino acid transport system ATPase component